MDTINTDYERRILKNQVKFFKVHKISDAAEPELACWKRANAIFISCFGWFGMGSDRSTHKTVSI